MREDGPKTTKGLVSPSDSRWKENEAICDRFDAAWRAGRQPSIEELLQTCQVSSRAALFRDLLEIEIEYRRRAGDTIDAANYHQRFPDFAAFINHVLDDPSLQRATTDATTDTEPTMGEAVGSTLGRYKLLQDLGTGGFGVVYLAEQQKPVRRRVALKIIKLGMDTKQVVARFEAERQVLALMDHPHIAKVLDAGATHTGRPYFVMELVKGIPITKYCDEQNVSLNDRLKLFMQVCAAVQHAHQKGIIHRDIKPSNVLVELVDNRPSPTLIDFGIAKATDHRLTEQTMYTELGQFIGTPAYMSPEQTEVQALDIDTRSDIYSLGVLLYELLTGATPFDVQKMASDGAGFDEIKRVIREEEPSKPSTKLSTLGQDASTVAKRRGIEPGKLTSILRGDLDWIVMKALEKDRGRRYETASAFAEDVRRFLANEVIEARPPSRRYRLAKYIRRNKGLVASLAAIAGVLIVGIIGTTLGLIAAREQQARATAEADRKQKVVDSFVSAFRSPDPSNEGVTSTMTARQVLEQAHATIKDDAELRDDPLAKATLLDAIGSSLKALGAYDDAVSAYEQSRGLRDATLGVDHPDTLASIASLADSCRLAGRLNEALDLFERVVDSMTTHLGPDDPLTLSAQAGLATTLGSLGRLDDAVRLHETVLGHCQSRLGKNDPKTITAQNNLAQAYISVGRQDDAILILEELMELSELGRGPDHPDTLTAMNNLANAYLQAGQLEQAISHFENVLKLSRSKLGEDHPDTAARLGNLGVACLRASRWSEAVPYLEKSLEVRRKSLGSHHQDTWIGMSNLAAAYWNVGRHDEALELTKDALEARTAKLGADHPDTLASMQNLAELYRRLGNLDDATRFSEEAVRLMSSKLGSDHPNALTAMNNLAAIYQDGGRLEDALDLGRKTLRVSQATLGKTHQETLRRMHNLAVSHQKAGQLDEAIPLSTKAVDLLGSHLGADHYLTLAATRSLASMYLDTGDVEQALSILEDVLRRMETAIGPAHQDTLKCKGHIAECYYAQGRLDEARAILEETVTAAKAQLGDEHPITESLQQMMDSLDAKRSAVSE